MLHVCNYTITTYRHFNIQSWDKHHSTQHEMAIPIIHRFFDNIKANYRKSHLAAENPNIIAVFTTHELMFVADEYIKIQEQLKDACTPHIIMSMMMPGLANLS